jgi:hypothetical protein
MPRSKSLWDLENAKNSEKKLTHPKGEQRISLCALCVPLGDFLRGISAISALKEVSTAVLRLKPQFETTENTEKSQENILVVRCLTFTGC